MHEQPSWPAVVLIAVEQAVGGALAVQRLGGMSVARVYRATGSSGSVIVKASPRDREAAFYRDIAPALRQQGVPIPGARTLGVHDGEHWLLVEDLPLSAGFRPEGPGWAPDPSGIAALVALHAATAGHTYSLEPLTAARLSPAANDAAAGCFLPAERARVADLLQHLQSDATALEQSWCWVSGDPSPPNWGRRTDGSLALFDWELFRPGTPASDLAPFVPGLQPAAAFEAATLAYVAAWRTVQSIDLPWDAATLARLAVSAKAGTVVSLLRAHVTGAARVPEDYVAGVVAALPGWLESVITAGA